MIPFNLGKRIQPGNRGGVHGSKFLSHSETWNPCNTQKIWSRLTRIVANFSPIAPSPAFLLIS